MDRLVNPVATKARFQVKAPRGTSDPCGREFGEQLSELAQVTDEPQIAWSSQDTSETPQKCSVNNCCGIVMATNTCVKKHLGAFVG
ncbi:hypothetical protein L596_000248 [Steinernema carpocapsae]|uniref:Uncharacterized protein n=1 Tax=Steinernema carpocapsae TaxID=34508 RepID=A0A4U8UI67_STECR|nr:hypothetical protein L596_000248 [Steinernema carpocapsae]